MKQFPILFFLVLLLFSCSSREEESAMVSVFEQYQAAVADGDTRQIMSLIDSDSRAYLLNHLEYLRQDDRDAIQAYVSKTQHPVLNVNMLARALNNYKSSQLESLSTEEFMDFDLGYLIELEQPLIEDFSFREKISATEKQVKLKFSRPMVDRNEVISLAFIQEEDGWKLNLSDRMHVLENNVRVVLKYAETSVWQHIADQLDKYYPPSVD